MAVVPNSDLNKYVIDWPFTLSNGAVSYIAATDPKVYKNKVRALLSTGTFERVWYYTYGADLTELLFEPTLVALEDAKAAVSHAFITWMPEVTLLDLRAEFDNNSGALTIVINYKIPSGYEDSVSVTTTSLTAAGESKDEYSDILGRNK